MDWYVLTDPTADVSDDARQALLALPPEMRADVARRIAERVASKLREKLDPWYEEGMRGPDVDVFGAELRDGKLVIHFIADHYNYCHAQSGSDWADHYFYAGEATLVRRRIENERSELVRQAHMTEQEDDFYRPSVMVPLVIAERRAKLRGETPDPRPFDDAVAAVRKANDERAQEARRKADAEAAAKKAAERTWTRRSPRCTSRDVACNPLFDDYQLECGSCGHSQVFEKYPERDDDSDWLTRA